MSAAKQAPPPQKTSGKIISRLYWCPGLDERDKKSTTTPLPSGALSGHRKTCNDVGYNYSHPSVDVLTEHQGGLGRMFHVATWSATTNRYEPV